MFGSPIYFDKYGRKYIVGNDGERMYGNNSLRINGWNSLENGGYPATVGWLNSDDTFSYEESTKNKYPTDNSKYYNGGGGYGGWALPFLGETLLGGTLLGEGNETNSSPNRSERSPSPNRNGGSNRNN